MSTEPGALFDQADSLARICDGPCFELGTIAAESHLSREGLAELVRHYLGRPRPSRTARGFTAPGFGELLDEVQGDD